MPIQSYFLIQSKIRFSNDELDLRIYFKPAWKAVTVYVEIVASLIIAISFIWNTNILSYPKKNIWSNICVLSISEISLFRLVHPTLNVTMSCCVKSYILVKSGKKNYQTFVGTYCPTRTDRTRYEPNKDEVGFSEVYFCKTTWSTPLTVLLTIFAVQISSLVTKNLLDVQVIVWMLVVLLVMRH